MKYTTLGKTNIKVSRICMGGMSFGQVFEDGHQWTLDQNQTRDMIKYAYDLGVNFIDTANCYSRGTSEEFIGQAIRNLGIPRDKVVIATKVYFNFVPKVHGTTTDEHLTRKAILDEVDGSLKRLNTDYIDLYQIHRFDYDTPIEETMETLDSLVKAGKVRAIGCSAMYGYQLQNMQIAAEKNGWTQFSTMQNHYNLLYREDEHEVIPVCKQYGMSLIPFSPLAGGHLSRSTWKSDSARSRTDDVVNRKYDHEKDNDMEIVARVKEVADKYHVSMSEVSLAWLYVKGVAAPIVGATKPNHFAEACKAIDLELTKEDVEYLEELYRPHALVGQITHDGKMY